MYELGRATELALAEGLIFRGASLGIWSAHHCIDHLHILFWNIIVSVHFSLWIWALSPSLTGGIFSPKPAGLPRVIPHHLASLHALNWTFIYLLIEFLNSSTCRLSLIARLPACRLYRAPTTPASSFPLPASRFPLPASSFPLSASRVPFNAYSLTVLPSTASCGTQHAFTVHILHLLLSIQCSPSADCYDDDLYFI